MHHKKKSRKPIELSRSNTIRTKIPGIKKQKKSSKKLPKLTQHFHHQKSVARTIIIYATLLQPLNTNTNLKKNTPTQR